MNRREEYQELLKELDSVPAELDGTLERAMKRRRKQAVIYRSLVGMAAAFTVFVLLVNNSQSIAHACSQIPILRELAEAVTISKSLSTAVENEYIQEINLVQREGDVTAEVEYLIVDQKCVVIFYKLQSDRYESLYSKKQILSADGSEELKTAYIDHNWASNGNLTYVRVEFEENVPDSMLLVMDVYAEDYYAQGQCAAHIEFLLEFDPAFTSVGRTLELNKEVEMNGQTLVIRDIEIYPTQMRINVTGKEENSAWLEGLEFYIQSEHEVFSSGVDGIISSGSMEENKMVSYRAESIYFYNAEELEVVITGAKWRDKQQEKAYLNLKTGENKGFPENIKFISTKNTAEGVEVWVEVEQPIESGLYMIFDSYYDAAGNEIRFGMQGGSGAVERIEGDREYVHQFGTIRDYQEEEVWIAFRYTDNVKLEEPIVVPIK